MKKLHRKSLRLAGALACAMTPKNPPARCSVPVPPKAGKVKRKKRPTPPMGA